MKKMPPATHENIIHVDPVTKQFVTADRIPMQVPKTMRSLPAFIYRLFTRIEQVLLTKKS